MPTRDAPQDRIILLDTLRAFAAIAIVLYHWPHFGQIPTGDLWSINKTALPLYKAIWPIYEHGDIAVDYFFCLSGFIFTLLYTSPIGSREIGAWAFFVKRFSRLYPLHLLTMLLVLILQRQLISKTFGYWFVYTQNDLKSAILNLFFIQAWLPNSEFSLNGPSWSVSIEILLYLAFFILARFFSFKPLIPATGILLGLLVYPYHPLIGRGFFAFFIGSSGAQIITLPAKRILISCFFLIAVITSAIYLSSIETAPFHSYLKSTNLHTAPLLAFFTISICLAYKLSPHTPKPLQRISFLGDASYAIYLLHFPLQLIVAYSINRAEFDRSIYYSPIFMITFFLCLIGLSSWTYRNFEKPFQGLIRHKLLPTKTRHPNS